MAAPQLLEFEEPLVAIYERLEKLEAIEPKTPAVHDEIRGVRRQLADTTREVYSDLDPWDTVRVARLAERPKFTDYVELVFDEFVELHGDKFFGDDRALRTGFAKLDGMKVMVVGHHKGKTFKERTECFFGCAHPEGYRKAMSKMRMASKYGMPIICLIDTPGAYPGIGAEERGQAQVIAQSMLEMSRLPTPIVCVVIGEGGSGGALGIGVGDRVAVMEHAYYSVISPEGCAGILWKSHDHAPKAARALRLTSKHLKQLGAVDDVIEEPLGGAHRDHYQMASRLKMYLVKQLRELREKPLDELVRQRYDKFRAIGDFLENPVAPAGDA
ncbi:acetyl-CoA carboxylase carboxyltransferase subunit alpha [Botrimarina hoheduenensis]|uniref:Acetyl-coenzyme A carboxylase carboxyl transferase subunit alpha n=1 Tax=Botrimarina hoheduenensis TaxID=2528000 RepID=A0A5C5VVL5_9BACT|nr:acetyl-CoA carboxylase carboxyltransferase subunit alpha [Botrimarina hoheduenensis]TWT41562.1 Acetyl-coenzyme A carboxylase carboxyl transferase subunit alpha [Botrimarina hoheduenensis]